MSKTTILFFGNPEYVLPILDVLNEREYSLAGIIANPDEPKGRGHILTPPPTKIWGQEHNIPVFQFEKITKESWEAAHIPQADLSIVASFGKLLPGWLLDIPKFKTLNIHPSLLPKYRGPSPIQTALLNGDQITGTSIMVLDEEMDHGPLIAQKEYLIADSDDALTLKQKLFMLGADMLRKNLPLWISGQIQATPQDETKATFTHILTKENGRISWNSEAQAIINQIRAYAGWPGTWTFTDTPHQIRIKIIKGHVISEATSIAPGTLKTHENALLVATQDFLISLDEIQVEGKAPISGSRFHASYPEYTKFI